MSSTDASPAPASLTSIRVTGSAEGSFLDVLLALKKARQVVFTFVDASERSHQLVRTIDGLTLVAILAGVGEATAAPSSAAAPSSEGGLLQVVFGSLPQADRDLHRTVFAKDPADEARVKALLGLGRVAALPEAILLDAEYQEGAVRLHPRYTEMGADLKLSPQSAAFSKSLWLQDKWPRNCAVVAPAELEMGLSKAAGPSVSTKTKLPFFSSHMAPESLLQYSFFSGDLALVKRLLVSSVESPPSAAGAILTSAVCYVNPPPEADDDDDGDDEDEDEEDGGSERKEKDGPPSPFPLVAPAPILHLPRTLCLDLGLKEGDFVCLLPYEEAPEAERVDFALILEDDGDEPEGGGRGAGGSVSGGSSSFDKRLSREQVTAIEAALHATFGVIDSRKASEAAAAMEGRLANATAATASAEGGGAGEASAPASLVLSNEQKRYLEELLKRGGCRYAPLVAGQAVPIPLAGQGRSSSSLSLSSLSVSMLRVVATQPRHTAVTVGPDTVLRLKATAVER